MQILESSRPIVKCEHFLILHFQVDISTQKQALGKISEFIASVCMYVCVLKQKCMCACVARAPAQRAFSVFVCLKACEDLTVGFPLYSVYAFFFGALVKRLLLLASNFALSVLALPLANPIHYREFLGQGWRQFMCKCLLKDSVTAFKKYSVYLWRNNMYTYL